MITTIIGSVMLISLALIVFKGFKRGQLETPRNLLSYSNDNRIESLNETIRNRYKFDESLEDIA